MQVDSAIDYDWDSKFAPPPNLHFLSECIIDNEEALNLMSEQLIQRIFIIKS